MFNSIITDDVLNFIDEYDADWLIEVILHKIKLPLYKDKVLPIGKVNIICLNYNVTVTLSTWTGEIISLEVFYDKNIPDGNWTLYYEDSLIYF